MRPDAAFASGEAATAMSRMSELLVRRSNAAADCFSPLIAKTAAIDVMPTLPVQAKLYSGNIVTLPAGAFNRAGRASVRPRAIRNRIPSRGTYSNNRKKQSTSQSADDAETRYHIRRVFAVGSHSSAARRGVLSYKASSCQSQTKQIVK